MIHGLDTGFLVAGEVSRHVEHQAARHTLSHVLARGDSLALAPQVLAEFIHVVTDARRFPHPMTVEEAIRLSENWWTARDVIRVFPGEIVTWRFLQWLREYSLGRKRLLDTLLAASYFEAGVRSILTTNPSDYVVFGEFRCFSPGSEPER
jgi:predicted nucleic acid-binding protein